MSYVSGSVAAEGGCLSMRQGLLTAHSRTCTEAVGCHGLFGR